MTKIPYGYRIENGHSVIVETEAEQIKALYRHYLSGLSLTKAAQAAGLNLCHGPAKRMMENRHYLGDDFFDAIVDRQIFEMAEDQLKQRAAQMGWLSRKKSRAEPVLPTAFRMGKAERNLGDPAQQAEYLYTLIESEAE